MYRFGYRLAIFCMLSVMLAQPVWAQKSGVSPDALILPQGPGSLGGIGENVSANLNMGLMSYPINIKIPGGRGSATPSISVSYSSSAGAGLMGIGWSINAGGSIRRLTVRGLPQYTNEDRFYASGELVPISGTPYHRARMEGGFVRYRWYQKDSNDQRGYWVAEYPDGSKGYYGANSKGEIDLDSQVYGLNGTYQWELRTMVDANGNRVEYTYFKGGSCAYFDTISWVFNKNDKPLYQIKFTYEDRPDPISDGKPGFDLQILKRITKITITSAGQTFRHYTFKYEDNTGLTRLSNVTRYGRDGKTPYPVAFSMKYSEATFSKENSRLVTIPTALGVNFANRKADLLDINGDGLPDVIDTAKSNHVFHINTLTLNDKLLQIKHDFPDAAKKINAKATSGAELSNASVQMIDYNGDGFTDMVDAVNKAIYINKGNGQWENSSGSLTSFPVNGKDANMRFFDYNGDKAIDVISANGSTTTYWVSNGKGEWKQVDGRPNLGAAVAQDKIRFIDINGDGLNDAVQILPKNMRYKKYLGYGNWSEWIDVKVPQLDKYELNTKAQFSDINGDGMADMVAFLGSSIVYFVNKNGKEFGEPQTIQDFFGKGIPDSTKSSVRIADMNGNGSRDIVWIDSNGQITYLEIFSERPNLLKEITNGIGQHIQISYGSSVYHYLRDQAANKSWRSKMPMAFPVVNEIKTWASRDKKDSGPDKACPQIQRIYYHDGYYDGIEKQFRGFREVESVMAGDESAGCEVKSIGERREMIRFYVGDGDTASGDNDLYYHGKMREKMTSGSSHDGKQITFNATKMEWKDCKVEGSKTTFEPAIRYICLTAQEQTIQEGETDKNKWKTIRSEYTYDGYGNVILTALLGEKDKSGDEKYFKNTYITPADPNDTSEKSLWFLRLLQRKQVCTSPTNGECATQEYYYDGTAYQGLAAGQVTHGNLTRSTARPSANADPINLVRRAYDSYGNVIGIKDGNGNLSKVEWDPEYSRFPIKNIKVLKDYELSYTTVWDIPYAVVRSSTDWNGNTTTYQYDVFGRLTQLYRPGDPNGKPSEAFTYKLQEPISTIIRDRRSQSGGEQDIRDLQCFDGLGRLLQRRTKVSSGSYLVTHHTVHNSSGMQAVNVRTYTASTEDCSFSYPQDAKVITNSYDGLGRLIKTTFPDNAYLRYIYQPFVKIEYDAEDNRKDSPHYNTPVTSTYDGLGRLLKEVKFSEPGKPLTSTFQWTYLNISGSDLPASTVDPSKNEKTQKYDLLGRVTEAHDPERQTYKYAYDDSGNLIRREESRGVVTVMTYDPLNRILTMQQEGKPETLIQYTYDKTQKTLSTATNLKAQLAMLSYPQGQEVYSYDRRGNLLMMRKVVMGRSFDFALQYDNLDRLTERTYPDSRKISYTYDGASRITTIPGFVKSLQYNATGNLSTSTLDNKIVLQQEYDVRDRLTRLNAQDGKVFDFKYTYDTVGNIMKVEKQQGDQQETQTYTYDSLYRLTRASLGQKEEITYQYGDEGNILSKTSSLGDKSAAHIGAYTYDPKRPRAVAKSDSNTYEYDAIGQLVKDNRLSYRWDFMGRLIEAKEGDTTVSQFWYDATLNRLIKKENNRYTLYISDDYEIRDGVAIVYVLIGKKKVASWQSPKRATSFYDDLAPAEGDKALTAKPDGAITAGDAWLYYAARNKLITLTVTERTDKPDMTMDMLQHSVSMMLSKDSEEKVFYHHDHLDSIVALTDAQGAVVTRKDYYPYGALRSQQGNRFSYGYTGSELDPSTQFNYLKARYLNPRLGRWISADPAFEKILSTDDEWNSYEYVQGNPLRFVDTTGTDTWDNIAFYGNKATAYTAVIPGLVGAILGFKKGSKPAGWAGVASAAIAATGAVLGNFVDTKEDSGWSIVATSLKFLGAATGVIGAWISYKGTMKAKETIARKDSTIKQKSTEIITKQQSINKLERSVTNLNLDLEKTKGKLYNPKLTTANTTSSGIEPQKRRLSVGGQQDVSISPQKSKRQLSVGGQQDVSIPSTSKKTKKVKKIGK